MSEPTHRQIAERAASRYGVFTREEARAIGMSDRAISDRAAAGRYRRVQPGVYAVAGAPETILQRIVGVVESFPELAAASHQTAAELWGLTHRGFRVVEVVTTRWDRVRRRAVKVHESLDLLPTDVVENHGIPVTSPARTVVDLGASNKWLVEAALDEGLRRGLFTLGEVDSFVARVARKGRRGVGVIRPLIESRRRWDAITESVLEARFIRVIDEGELPEPVAQYVVRDQHNDFVCRSDFAYPQARILIELDSEAYHSARVAFIRDRLKQNRATLLGWTVLRYTWWDLSEQPARVWAEIRTALSAAS
jgi:hypothetical protein